MSQKFNSGSTCSWQIN